MRSGKSLKSHDWQIVGLSDGQLELVKRLTKYSGPDGLPFFEQAVWWWRPLLKIIGPKAHAIEVPPKSHRGFFPAFVFREMRANESGSIGGLQDILESWFTDELAARLDGAHCQWPAYMVDTSKGCFPGWENLHLAEFPARTLDLRKTDSELLAEFKAELKQLREDCREQAPWPVDDRTSKSSYLSEHSFAVIELIDRKKFSIGKEVGDGEWANVNKALRSRAEKFSKREYFHGGE